MTASPWSLHFMVLLLLEKCNLTEYKLRKMSREVTFTNRQIAGELGDSQWSSDNLNFIGI